MKLSGRGYFGFSTEPFLGFVESAHSDDVWAIRTISDESDSRVLVRVGDEGVPQGNMVCLGREFGYLGVGDIIRLNPISGDVRVLYRRNSKHNSLFFTERCNSRCLMCSQPPRDINDDYLVTDILRSIPWMSKDTPELGITGGEATLLHERLIEVLVSTKTHLPKTAVHLLTNGRLLSYLRYAEQIADVAHPDLMLGIPLYSDLAAAHDFVVQAKGAFEQTLFGILNLGRVGARVEIRMVIHAHTFERLPQFARYVARNIPFVSQVVLMGLEMMGFARTNLNSLWVDPADYQDQLEEAVMILEEAGIPVMIYNHQLCVLRPSLHRFARKSISDWKNIYMPPCDGCSCKDECGGFFASAGLRYSSHIKPYMPAGIAATARENEMPSAPRD